MAGYAALPLQSAVFTALTGDASLVTALGGTAKIYDYAPQDTNFPYVTIGEIAGQEWDTKGTDGQRSQVTVHVWSRKRGMKETRELLAHVYRILHRASLTVAGHTLVHIRYLFDDAFTEDGGQIFHGVMRFEAITQD